MKITNLSIILYLLIILIISCSNPEKKRIRIELKSLNEEFSETKSNFNKEFIDHFPKEFDENYITDKWSLNPYSQFSIKLFNKIPKQKLKKTIKKYNKNSLSIYNPLDECLLILNRFSNNNNNGYMKLTEVDQSKIDLECYDDLYPIPNFWEPSDFLSNKTECHLPKDFKIYVLDAKPGKFLDKDELTKGRFMPPKWKNGFSKGVAISEERMVIIYWVIVW